MPQPHAPTFELHILSIEDYAAFLALVRNEPLDSPALAALTERLRTSSSALQSAVEEATPSA